MGVDPVVQLEARVWRRGVGGERLARRLRAWAAVEPALARFGSAEALFRFLRSEPSAERDAVFRTLLASAKTDELAGLVLLEALLPGLKRLAGQLLIETRNRDSVWAVLLACAWERIRAYPLERRPRRLAANLLLDTRKAVAKELGRELYPPEQPRALGALGQPYPACRADDIDALLDRAVAAGALSRREAELIASTRIDGLTLAELAGRLGIPYHTLSVRRIRAERRLLLFLGCAAVTSGGRDRHISPAREGGAGSAD
jgi:DNA-directed RNA polymerase specialized sigma24 family protein